VQARRRARFDDVPDRDRRIRCHHRQVRDVALQPPAVIRRRDHAVGDEHHQIRALEVAGAQPQLVEQAGHAVSERGVAEHRGTERRGFDSLLQQARGHRVTEPLRIPRRDAEGGGEHRVAGVGDARREHRDQPLEAGAHIRDHRGHRVDSEL